MRGEEGTMGVEEREVPLRRHEGHRPVIGEWEGWGKSGDEGPDS